MFQEISSLVYILFVMVLTKSAAKAIPDRKIEIKGVMEEVRTD